MVVGVETGRRERKKARTRTALADAALALFLERGYEDVTVAEIADAADVSVTTLFNHFPDGKPALVFDEADARREALVAAVHDRRPGTGALDAALSHLRAQSSITGERTEQMARFLDLVRSHRALVEHYRRTWAVQESALAAALAEAAPDRDPEEAAALAHLVVDGFSWALTRPDPAGAFDRMAGLLRDGYV
jgi:AcrR family transcriptional regulator